MTIKINNILHNLSFVGNNIVFIFAALKYGEVAQLVRASDS
jgi:hypothetical protein